LGLSEPQSFWLGPLPPQPRNIDIAFGLGGEQPRDCLILPVVVKSKVVCYLYADNMDQGVGGAPLAALRTLVTKASMAFQVYILKSKIRMLH
jgi:hypothetical protein